MSSCKCGGSCGCSGAVAFSFPVLIKSALSGSKRTIEVEASNQRVDLEGDVILQESLLKSAPYFVKNGHIDYNHFSELFPESGDKWVVGKPLEVIAGDNKSTIVKGEILSGAEFDPKKNVYDALWLCLTTEPEIKWYASVYGLTTDKEDCRDSYCDYGATRYLVKGMEWRSMALTQKPMNNTLTGTARIVKARYLQEILKHQNFVNFPAHVPEPESVVQESDIRDIAADRLQTFSPPYHVQTIVATSLDCWDCADRLGGELLPWMNHYMNCEGLDIDTAELLARASAHYMEHQI